MNTPIPLVAADCDGLARIGRTLHDLRGIRHNTGESGNSPASTEPTPTGAVDDPAPSQTPVEVSPWGDEFTPERVAAEFAKLKATKGFDQQERLDELEKAASEAERATLTDTQRLERERDDARSGLAETEAELAKLRAAIKHGFGDDELKLLADIPAEKVEAFADSLAARLDSTPLTGRFRRHPRETFSSGGAGVGTLDKDLSTIGAEMFAR